MRILAVPGPGSSINPYPFRLYRELTALGATVERGSIRGLLRARADIWHVHWPESAASDARWSRAASRSAWLVTAMVIARLVGTKNVWTVHNIVPHENPHPRLSRWVAAAWVRLLDGYICHTEGGRAGVLRQYPQLAHLPAFVIPHGHYRGDYPIDGRRTDARAALGLGPGDVLLFAGLIRPYKNVVHLIRTVRAMPDPRPHLLAVGEATSKELELEVRRAAEGDPHVHVRLERVPAAEFARYFAASTLVVLPFTEVLNSGSAILALSLDVPVLVPRLGAMPELADAVGADWVRLFDDTLDGVELRRALEWARATAPRRGHAPLESFNWDGIARSTLTAFAALSRSSVA